MQYLPLVSVVLLTKWVLVDTRSFVRTENESEDRDGHPGAGSGIQMSFIEEFLGLATPSEDDNERQEENDNTNERQDKILWTEEEVIQLKQSEALLQDETSIRRNHQETSHQQQSASEILAAEETPSAEREGKVLEQIDIVEMPAHDSKVVEHESDTLELKEVVPETLEKKEDVGDTVEQKEVAGDTMEDKEVVEADPDSLVVDGLGRIPSAAPDTDAVQFNTELIEKRYTELVQAMPARLEEAREVIIKTIATRNMLGFTFVGAYIIGAILDTTAILLLYPNSLTDAVTRIFFEPFTHSFLHWIWWYAFGFSGPWMFPNTFHGGDPGIEAGSAQYFALFKDFDLTLNIQSFTEKSPAAALILSEKLRRDFDTRLGPIVGKRGEYREAEMVQQTFNEMMNLVNLHSQLHPKPASGRDLDLLDTELVSLWNEMRVLTEETHTEVSARRAETAAIYIFIALLNIAGMLGGVFLSYARIDMELKTLKEKRDKDYYEKMTDVANWIFTDNHPSEHVKELGGVALILANLGWGYSYSFAYLLFLEQYDPGCGTLQLDDVYARHFRLNSVKETVEVLGVSVLEVRWELEEWRRDLRQGLHCLVSTEEGGRLSHTINMFYNLASARLDLTNINIDRDT